MQVMTILVEVSIIAFVELVPKLICVQIAVVSLVGCSFDSVTNMTFIRHVPGVQQCMEV